MEDQDSDFGFRNERAQALARLATLQRLKDEMRKNNRQAMLEKIEQMMASETELLRRLRDRDQEAA